MDEAGIPVVTATLASLEKDYFDLNRAAKNLRVDLMSLPCSGELRSAASVMLDALEKEMSTILRKISDAEERMIE